MLIDFLYFEKYTEMNKEQLSGAVGCSNKLSSSVNINEGEWGKKLWAVKFGLVSERISDLRLCSWRQVVNQCIISSEVTYRDQYTCLVLAAGLNLFLGFSTRIGMWQLPVFTEKPISVLMDWPWVGIDISHRVTYFTEPPDCVTRINCRGFCNLGNYRLCK